MKCLVVSYGSIGRRHYRILSESNVFEEVHVITKQDIPDVKCYSSILEAISLNQYEYIVIASPTSRHFEDLIEILKSRFKAVILVEKPLFGDYSDNSKAILKSEELFVGYNLRFHTVITELKKILQEHSEVFYANFYAGQYLPLWRPGRDYNQSYSSKKKEGGGVLLDLSHEVDLLHYLFGEISSCTSVVTHRSDLAIETEDIALVQGVTKRNVIFTISLDYLNMIPMRKILIHTKKSSILADIMNSKITITETNGKTNDIVLPTENRDYTYLKMHTSIIAKDFSTLCSFQDGLRINYWIDQIKKNSLLKELTHE